MKTILLKLLHSACAALACMAVSLGAGEGVVDLGEAASDGVLWEKTLKELCAEGGELAGLRCARVDKNTLRLPRRNTRKIRVDALRTGDIVLRFGSESEEEPARVNSLQTTIYNKGDDGELDKDDFEQRLKSSVDVLNELLETEGQMRRTTKKETGVRVRAWEWVTENCSALLEASSTGSGKKYVAEFIRLTMAPAKEQLEKGGAGDGARRSELKTNVVTEPDGTVWIKNIPMVDQGEKGYCVPASISRVFAYYGMDGVDQHALAALCKSTGEQGTTLQAMDKALSSISNSFRMGVTSWEWVNLKTLSKEYGKKAQRAHASPDMLSPALLLKVLKDKPSLMRKGFTSIRKHIDAGIPVVWGVLLGLYPEPGLPQAFGGHMRLIIGYNEQKQTIIYSDSWGAGHEKKEMPLTQACGMSRILYVLRPLR